MKKHHTKDKGDLAVAKCAVDLTTKGYVVLSPLFSEHQKFDLVAYKNNIFYKIQVKYSSGGVCLSKIIWSSKSAIHSISYEDTDFDYYCLYLKEKDVCIYPSIKFKGKTIHCSPPYNNGQSGYYFYEDFLDFTDDAVMRKDLKKNDWYHTPIRKPILSDKIPSKDELTRKIWEKPMTKIAKDYSVSDKTVANWATKLSIVRPPVGYWVKKPHSS